MLTTLINRFNDFRWSLGQFRRLKRAGLTQQFGHAKTIGREAGRPVHSLFVPADYSQPSTEAQARLYQAVRYGRIVPVLASLELTTDCHCNCAHCSAASSSAKSANGKPLTVSEWQRVVGELQDLGVMTLLFGGGEPLLAPALEPLLQSVDRRRSIGVLTTSGHRLTERLHDLHRRGLNRLVLSLDFPDAEAHDAHRGMPGLFAEVQASVQQARRLGMLTALSTFASPQRLEDGTLDAIVARAAEWSVNEVMIFDLMPAGRAADISVPAQNDPYYQRLLAHIRTRQDAYPQLGIWSYAHSRSSQACGCAAGGTYLRLRHNGDVLGCDFGSIVYGNVRDQSLAQIYRNALKTYDGACDACGQLQPKAPTDRAPTCATCAASSDHR